jgi:hypothetical protein
VSGFGGAAPPREVERDLGGPPVAKASAPSPAPAPSYESPPAPPAPAPMAVVSPVLSATPHEREKEEEGEREHKEQPPASQQASVGEGKIMLPGESISDYMRRKALEKKRQKEEQAKEEERKEQARKERLAELESRAKAAPPQPQPPATAPHSQPMSPTQLRTRAAPGQPEPQARFGPQRPPAEAPMGLMRAPERGGGHTAPSSGAEAPAPSSQWGSAGVGLSQPPAPQQAAPRVALYNPARPFASLFPGGPTQPAEVPPPHHAEEAVEVTGPEMELSRGLPMGQVRRLYDPRQDRMVDVDVAGPGKGLHGHTPPQLGGHAQGHGHAHVHSHGEGSSAHAHEGGNAREHATAPPTAVHVRAAVKPRVEADRAKEAEKEREREREAKRREQRDREREKEKERREARAKERTAQLEKQRQEAEAALVARREARAKEKRERGPRTKGVLYRYDEKGDFVNADITEEELLARAEAREKKRQEREVREQERATARAQADMARQAQREAAAKAKTTRPLLGSAQPRGGPGRGLAPRPQPSSATSSRRTSGASSGANSVPAAASAMPNEAVPVAAPAPAPVPIPSPPPAVNAWSKPLLESDKLAEVIAQELGVPVQSLQLGATPGGEGVEATTSLEASAPSEPKEGAKREKKGKKEREGKKGKEKGPARESVPPQPPHAEEQGPGAERAEAKAAPVKKERERGGGQDKASREEGREGKKKGKDKDKDKERPPKRQGGSKAAPTAAQGPVLDGGAEPSGIPVSVPAPKPIGWSPKLPPHLQNAPDDDDDEGMVHFGDLPSPPRSSPPALALGPVHIPEPSVFISPLTTPASGSAPGGRGSKTVSRPGGDAGDGKAPGPNTANAPRASPKGSSPMGVGAVGWPESGRQASPPLQELDTATSPGWNSPWADGGSFKQADSGSDKFDYTSLASWFAPQIGVGGTSTAVPLILGPVPGGRFYNPGVGVGDSNQTWAMPISGKTLHTLKTALALAADGCETLPFCSLGGAANSSAPSSANATGGSPSPSPSPSSPAYLGGFKSLATGVAHGEPNLWGPLGGMGPLVSGSTLPQPQVRVAEGWKGDHGGCRHVEAMPS